MKANETNGRCPQCRKHVTFLIDLDAHHPSRGKACAGCAWKNDHGVLNAPRDRTVNPRSL